MDFDFHNYPLVGLILITVLIAVVFIRDAGRMRRMGASIAYKEGEYGPAPDTRSDIQTPHAALYHANAESTPVPDELESIKAPDYTFAAQALRSSDHSATLGVVLLIVAIFMAYLRIN